MGYSFRLTARVLLYAPSHRQDCTYHGLCYTSRGALAGATEFEHCVSGSTYYNDTPFCFQDSDVGGVASHPPSTQYEYRDVGDSSDVVGDSRRRDKSALCCGMVSVCVTWKYTLVTLICNKEGNTFLFTVISRWLHTYIHTYVLF